MFVCVWFCVCVWFLLSSVICCCILCTCCYISRWSWTTRRSAASPAALSASTSTLRWRSSEVRFSISALSSSKRVRTAVSWRSSRSCLVCSANNSAPFWRSSSAKLSPSNYILTLQLFLVLVATPLRVIGPFPTGRPCHPLTLEQVRQTLDFLIPD